MQRKSSLLNLLNKHYVTTMKLCNNTVTMEIYIIIIIITIICLFIFLTLQVYSVLPLE